MADKHAPVIIIKKKKGGHGGHHGGAWKVAYADFVTAMMAFFLVMWLMGADEATKAAIQEYFLHPGSGSPISEYPTDPKGGDKLDAFQQVNPPAGRTLDMPAGKVNAATTSEAELQNLKEVLEETISLELGVSNPSDQLEMVYDSKGLVLRIAVKGFFEHDASDVRQDLLPVLYRIGKVLSTSQKVIRIEGHTEPTETQGGRSLASGDLPAWDLSTKRAAWVANYWIKNFPMLKPERLQVAGVAHFHPIADNSTAEGQATNRRVEIIVLNEQYK
jgi:chemotaxis protein MotB